MQKLTIEEFKQFKLNKSLLIDTRSIEAAAEKIHIDSLNIPWSEYFLETFQNLIESDQQITILCDEQNAAAISKALKGSGFSHINGFVTAEELLSEKTSVIITVEADEFAIDFNYDEFYLIDVRTNEEFEKEHLEWAENMPIDDIAAMSQELGEKMRIYAMGSNAEQAFTAVSLLKQNGIELARAVLASFDEIKATGLPTIKATKSNKATY